MAHSPCGPPRRSASGTRVVDRERPDRLVPSNHGTGPLPGSGASRLRRSLHWHLGGCAALLKSGASRLRRSLHWAVTWRGFLIGVSTASISARRLSSHGGNTSVSPR